MGPRRRRRSILRVRCELGRVNSWRADSEKGNQVIRALLKFGLVKQEAKGGALRIKKALEGEWHDHQARPSLRAIDNTQMINDRPGQVKKAGQGRSWRRGRKAPSVPPSSKPDGMEKTGSHCISRQENLADVSRYS